MNAITGTKGRDGKRRRMLSRSHFFFRHHLGVTLVGGMMHEGP
jgi:hypothetical protein